MSIQDLFKEKTLLPLGLFGGPGRCDGAILWFVMVALQSGEGRSPLFVNRLLEVWVCFLCYFLVPCQWYCLVSIPVLIWGEVRGIQKKLLGLNGFYGLKKRIQKTFENHSNHHKNFDSEYEPEFFFSGLTIRIRRAHDPHQHQNEVWTAAACRRKRFVDGFWRFAGGFFLFSGTHTRGGVAEVTELVAILVVAEYDWHGKSGWRGRDGG